MRPSKDTYFLSMALLASSRATCSRRSVGCILTNERGHVLATGYNGVAAGCAHCIDAPCPGANLPSGTGLDHCRAIHAEQNALLQCKNVYEIDTAYITASACVTCTKLLMNTSCKRIVFLDEYPQPDAKAMWESVGREWVKYDGEKLVLITKDVKPAL